MKTPIIIFTFFAVILAACRSVDIYRIESGCPEDSAEETLLEISVRLEQRGFDPEIKRPDSISYVKQKEVSWQGGADLSNPNKWSGADEIRRWSLHSRNGKIYAFARVQTVLKNVYGDKRFIHDKFLSDDRTDKHTKWYWEIRNLLEEKCPRNFEIRQLE
jgi:hypothetical protein